MVRGVNYEREFCDYALERGFHAERVAGSGHRRTSVCDVVLVKNGKCYLVEVKSTLNKTYYLSDKTGVKERITKLIETAQKSGAIPLLAVRFKGKRWVVKKLTPQLVKVSLDDESLF